MFLALDDYFPLWTHWQGLPVKLRDMILTPPPQAGGGGGESTVHKRDEMGERGSDQISGITEYCKTDDEIKCGGVTSSEVNREDGAERLYTSRVHAESVFKQTNTTSQESNSLHITGTQNDGDNKDRKYSSGVEKCVCDEIEPPGTVVYERKARVVRVRCADGWVSFRQVVVKGRKPMSAQDFYNGFISKVPKEMSRFARATKSPSSTADDHTDSVSLPH